MGRPQAWSCSEPLVRFGHILVGLTWPCTSAATSRISRCRRGVRHSAVAVALFAATVLCGCSASYVIDRYAADYRETAASAGDAQLLLNILRAKDDLPIHFSDLSIIRGSIQWSAGSTASFPLAQNGVPTPVTLSPSLSAQNSPSFDLGTLDTKEFTRGMLTPTNPQIIKQLFDQGVDPRLIMILFFSDYRDQTGLVFQNNMSCDLKRELKDGECYNRIYKFLEVIDGLFCAAGLGPEFTPESNTPRCPKSINQPPQHLHANVYVALRPVGGVLSGPWTLKESVDSLRQLDPAKFKVVDLPEAALAGGRGDELAPYRRLYAVSEPRLAICYERGGSLKSLFPTLAGNRACNNNEVIIPYDKPTQKNTFSIRSPYQIIQFLGQVLRFQEEKRANRCLTLSANREHPEQRQCDIGDVLFQVNSPVGEPVVTTRYDNALYSVNYRNCIKEHEEHCDYSLQVMAILELLINANKSATDIVATPSVRTVP